jgi:ABC-type dipeptide/oligopeptide/nickel transport system permease component
VPLLLGLTVFTFALGQLAPGDPARALLLGQQGSPPTDAQVRALRVELGLDRPAVVQYWRWVRAAAAGDLGRSFRSGQSVAQSLKRALPVTVELALLAFLVVLGVGIPVGVVAALTHRGPTDHLIRILSVAGAAIPSYWLGYLLIIVFSVQLGLLATSGVSSTSSYVLPALTLAVYPTSVMVRLTRTAMLDALAQDHVRAARGRGLSQARIVRHALRNALNPIVTYGGLVLGGLLAGAVIVETVFGMPGVGRLAVGAIDDGDLPVVQGFVLLVGTIVLVVNLAVDVLYAVLDPRVRLGGASGGPGHAA